MFVVLHRASAAITKEEKLFMVFMKTLRSMDFGRLDHICPEGDQLIKPMSLRVQWTWVAIFGSRWFPSNALLLVPHCLRRLVPASAFSAFGGFHV
jgi:hypothetical protein